MANWGKQDFKLTGLDMTMGVWNDLEAAVRTLPAIAKQAFYSAAMRRGVIRRKTWDGCAFNAGGIEIGKKVYGYQAAADAFGCKVTLVKRFIHAWDHSKYPSDREATKALVEMLEKVGIFSEPNRPKVVIVQDKVYEGNMTEAALLENFKKELDTMSITGFDEAYELLFKESVCQTGT